MFPDREKRIFFFNNQKAVGKTGPGLGGSGGEGDREPIKLWSCDSQPQQRLLLKIQDLYFSLAPHLGLMKVGLNQTVGERLTNSLLPLSDKAVPMGMMENNEPWKSGSFYTPSWASFPKKRNVACPVFIMGLDSFSYVGGIWYGQIVIMLYYLLVHFALRTLQSLTSVCLL